MARLHIVGAGLAGLAAAVAASRTARWDGIQVYEATAQAGGRCRSFYDERLGRVIDNGNHLLLGANRAALAYLDAIGGRGAMCAVEPAAIPFLDLGAGEQWTLRPNAGPLPWWLLSRSRGVPGARLSGHLRLARLAVARRSSTVAEAVGRPHDALYRRLWDPLATAVLNTAPEAASARLFRRVLLALAAAGGAGLRPFIAGAGLSSALVDPALQLLHGRQVDVAFGWRLRGLTLDDARITALDFGKARVPIAPRDGVILAVPPEAAGGLVPGLPVPTEASPIVNLHFRLDELVRLPGGYPFLGLVGGTAQWLFARGDLLSVTVSAAWPLLDLDHRTIAERIWADIADLGIPGSRQLLPPFRVIKERRATIAQTPAAILQRPGPRTRFRNLILAGDWIDTGLPATIEGAIRSGRTAARLAGMAATD